MNTTTKPWYQSRTYWGLFVALFSTIAQIIQPTGAALPIWLVDFVNNNFVDLATQVGQFLGLAIAAWGRNKATSAIVLTKGKK